MELSSTLKPTVALLGWTTTLQLNATTTQDIRQLSEEELAEILDVMFWVQGVLYSVLGVVGVLANILNIITLSRSVKLVTYKIFLGMACADLMVMMTVLGYSLAFCVYRPIRIQIGQPPNLKLGATYSLYVWKQLWFMIMNIFMGISNWCAVLMATFRLLVITFPLRAVTYASTTRVHICIALVYVLGILIQIPEWLPNSFDENGAMVLNKKLYRYEAISVIVGGLLPLTICVIATGLLVLQLNRNQKQMKDSLRKEQLAGRLRDQKQLTVTLLLVLCFYVTTNVPTMIYWLLDEQDYFNKFKISKYRQNLFYFGSSACMVANYAGNFFIYILANATFRKDIHSVFLRFTSVCKPRGKRPMSSRSTTRMLSGTQSTDQNTDHTAVPMSMQ